MDELSKRMSLKELNAWATYYMYEPWGSFVDGKRQAMTASVIANSALAFSSSKKRPFKLKDFEIGCGVVAPPKKRTWEETFKMFDAISVKKDKKG